MSRPIDRMSAESLHAVLDYLHEEVQCAETEEDLRAVMEIARDLFAPSRVQSAVRGLGHIRAEFVRQQNPGQAGDEQDTAAAQDVYACTVSLEVPTILSTMFHDLSERMNRLQCEDPETFANATSALQWLANGNIQTN